MMYAQEKSEICEKCGEILRDCDCSHCRNCFRFVGHHTDAMFCADRCKAEFYEMRWIECMERDEQHQLAEQELGRYMGWLEEQTDGDEAYWRGAMAAAKMALELLRCGH